MLPHCVPTVSLQCYSLLAYFVQINDDYYVYTGRPTLLYSSTGVKSDVATS